LSLPVIPAKAGILSGKRGRGPGIYIVAFPDLGLDPRALAVAGMAAIFTGVVQAPITGIVLVTEMTANFPVLLPMVSACFAAMLVPNLLGAVPIYDSLGARTAKLEGPKIP